MRRYAIGDSVGFQSNTGRRTQGQIIQILVEKTQPDILLIERPDDRWRAFRLETEVSPLPAKEPGGADAAPGQAEGSPCRGSGARSTSIW